ncbi:MAG: hypothetical protein HS117_04140 [Verrucomicrobiaceae bacterium]|nr:hypothetical protein [Verrucomicrobiaceae bacterium]
MKTAAQPKTRVSAFMREMWAAEAEHPVFAGSLQNFKLLALPRNTKQTRTNAARSEQKSGR